MNSLTRGKIHYCEKTGIKVSLANTAVLKKIDTIFRFDGLAKLEIDETEKKIKFGDRVIRYDSKINVPNDLAKSFEEIYAIAPSNGHHELSTALLSPKGEEIFIVQQLNHFNKAINKYGLIRLFGNELFIKNECAVPLNTKIRKCICCNEEYLGVDKKYMAEKILHSKTHVKTWGNQDSIPPGYDLAISDCSHINRVGTGYLFITDKIFREIFLCSNECAVEYCIENKVIISYQDFMNKAKIRILCPYTKKINEILGNDYKYRSSAI